MTLPDHWLYLLTSAVFSGLACVGLALRAEVLGLIDVPDRRKHHVGNTPIVGGIGMFFALILTAAIYSFPLPSTPHFLFGAALFLLIGLLDDRFELPARPRLIAQMLAVLVSTVPSGLQLDHLGALLGPWMLSLGWLAIPFTMIAITGVANAINMSDGIDGLSGSIALVSLSAFGIALGLIHAETGAGHSLLPLLIMLAGALIGFLVFNLRTPWRSRASLFMGDAGTLFLGYTLAWLAVHLSQKLGPNGLPPVAALWILLVPLFDTLSCMIRRISEGKSPMSADRRHVHHLLLSRGISQGRVVVILVTINACAGATGLLGWRLGVPDSLMFGVFLMLLTVFTHQTVRFWKNQRIDTEPLQTPGLAPTGSGN